MIESEVIDILYVALRNNMKDARINDVTMDNDSDSAEIILTTDDGNQKQCFVISSSNINETDGPEDQDGERSWEVDCPNCGKFTAVQKGDPVICPKCQSAEIDTKRSV